MSTKEYPAEGVPWADYLHHRLRLLAEWREEGKTAEQCVRDLEMDAGQVRLLWMTYDQHPEVYGPVGKARRAATPGKEG